MFMLPLKLGITAVLSTILLQSVYAQQSLSPQNIRDLISAELTNLEISRFPVNIVSPANVIYLDQHQHDSVKFYEELLPSMSRVTVVSGENGLRKVLGGGSGVAITEDKILTNCHLLPRSDEMNGKIIYVQDFQKRTHVSKLIAGDVKSDRCILELKQKILKPVKGIRHKDSVKVGETIYAIGSPRGFDHVFSAGHIAWISGQKAKRKIYLSTAATAKGSSGGGLFDRAGYLIGITTAFLTDSSQFSVIIPAQDYVLAFGE